MGERLPRITSTQLLRALRRAGWLEVRRAGSHVHLKQAVAPERRVTVPDHRGRTLKPATLAAVLDQAGITADELRELL